MNWPWPFVPRYWSFSIRTVPRESTVSTLPSITQPSHAALVDQFHAMLDAADPVGDGGEVADSELLLVFHAERAVIGRHDRQLVHAQALPQITLVAVAHLTDVVGVVILRAHRCRAHP